MTAHDGPTIPLSRAALCLDCDTVFDISHVPATIRLPRAVACPACGSRALVLLVHFVNRKEVTHAQT